MENRSSNPGRKIVELSLRLQTVSHRQEQEMSRKTPQKSRIFPARNTFSMKLLAFPGTDHFLAVLSDLGVEKIIIS
jgi:hypothetical protein